MPDEEHFKNLDDKSPNDIDHKADKFMEKIDQAAKMGVDVKIGDLLRKLGRQGRNLGRYNEK